MIMSSIYVNSISKYTSDIGLLNAITYEQTECIISILKNLIKDGFVCPNKKNLTKKGRSSIKVVLTGGVFDIIHPGHIYTLNSAKVLGDVLIVVIATDKTVTTLKRKKPLHNQEQRCSLINSLKMVDLAIVGSEKDIFTTVKDIKPEIIALGYDQTHQEKYITNGCRKLNLNVKITRLYSPVPEISSSKIEKNAKLIR
ncbi:MAG: FAD synthase [Nitrosopumilaceae archaeon]|nr:FAD synthase [Nitrosopumilaceae archaeon]